MENTRNAKFTGALAWLTTDAMTISHTTRGQKGQYVIAVHHMLGYGRSR